MASVLGVPEVTLSIIIGTLAAIVYSLRILVLMERKMARMEEHLERMANKIVGEETKIEKMLNKRSNNAKNKRRKR